MLKRFLRWLWCPGPCKYEILEKFNIHVDYSPTPSYRRYAQKCVTCGNMRAFNGE